MREIKFRAWVKRERKLHESYFGMHYASFSEICNGIANDSGVPLNVDSFSIDDIEIMQFTGLKDKDGKEIYEGDIILRGGKKHIVYYNNQIGGFDYLDEVDWRGQQEGWKPIGFQTSSVGAFNLKVDEVIGNIYEDPELLEVKG